MRNSAAQDRPIINLWKANSIWSDGFDRLVPMAIAALSVLLLPFAFGADDFIQHEKYDGSKQTTLADKYLQEFDRLTSQGQKYQAIIWSLTELASLIDSAATRYEIEYEIGAHLHTALNSVDVRDREMKKQFQELQGEVDQLKSDIDKLVNETRAELQSSMKQVRKDIIKSLREIVAQSIDKNREVAEKVQKKVSKSVGAFKKTTTAQAVTYFIGFQILLFLCIYFYSKYIQQIRFN
jgi:ElaB/YqjD/DUF883 family membrane-anchored ribosome-binding protein